MNRSLQNTGGLMAAASLALLLTIPAVAFARYDDARLLTPSPKTVHVATPRTATSPTTTADAQLEADLAFMREEERLAHDVYTVLGEKWGTPIFSNIAVSEQRHTDTLAALMTRYSVSDPAKNEGAGVYAYPELQTLYDTLVAKGSVSATAALEVGKSIEEVDIADLDARITRTDETDVLAAFKNLRAGSVNHLRAFTNQLSGSAGRGNGTSGTGTRRGSGRQ